MRRHRQLTIRVLCGLLGLAAAAAVVAAGGVRLVTPPAPDAVILRLDPRVARPPVPVAGVARDRELLVRADRLQYQHRFDAAEAALGQWLAKNPGDGAVLLKRAQLRIAMGRPQAALADCLRAAANLPALAASGCEAQVLGSLGERARARRLIESALAAAGAGQGAVPATASAIARQPARADLSWAAGIAAELADRAGDPLAAERWHKLALATAGHSHYPRIAYAEFLLAQRQPERVLKLLAAAPDDAAVMSLRRRALLERRT